MTRRHRHFVHTLAAAMVSALALSSGPAFAADKSLTPDTKPAPAQPGAKPGSAAAKAADEAAQTPYSNIEEVLKASETVTGGVLAFPSSDPAVHSYIVTLQPGETTAWHKHEAPMFAYILEGEVTVTYDGNGKKVFSAGDGLLEAQDVVHRGENTGETPVRILTVVMLGDGKAATQLTAPPGNDKAAIE